MRFSLSMTLLFLAGAAVGTGACGPNVILDGGSASTGTGAPTGNGGAGFGGTSVNGTTAPGVGGGGFAATSTVAVGTGGGFSGTTTVAVGTGGGFSGTSTAVGTGGVFSGPSSTAAGTGGVSATTATSTGTGAMGACNTLADSMILQHTVIYPLIVKCATSNLGNTGGETMCIESSTQLSPACTSCVVEDVLCSLKSCINVCANDPNGTSCKQCRDQSCGAAFVGCSGLADAPGSTTCGDLFASGTKGSGWQLGVPAEAFISNQQFLGYNDVNDCACQGFAPAGCEQLCNDAFSNGPPDFCNGAKASPPCLMCLESTCGSQVMTCEAAN